MSLATLAVLLSAATGPLAPPAAVLIKPVAAKVGVEMGPEPWGEVRVSPERAPSLEFTVAPNGAEIAFFDHDRKYHLYDLATQRVTSEVTADAVIHGVSYSPDGKSLATAEWTAGVKVRDAKTGKVLDSLAPETNLGAFSTAYLPDGRLAAHCWWALSLAEPRRLKEQLAVWDPASKARLGWPATVHAETDGVMVRSRFVGFGRHLLALERRFQGGYVVDQSVTVTDPATGKPSAARPISLDDYVLDASPDGRTLLMANPDRPLRLVDVASGLTTRVFVTRHAQLATCGAISPDGKLAATASGVTHSAVFTSSNFPPATTSTEVILWDLATGKRVATCRGPTRNHDFARVAFAPDGKSVVAGGPRGSPLVLWGRLPKLAPEAAAAHDARSVQAELAELRSEVARLKASRDPAVAADARFRDAGDHVVDTRTGLLWQKDGAASGKLNYYDAIKYATCLELGGRAGWRVPTRDELAGVFPAADAPFTNTRYNKEPLGKGVGEWVGYWSSTTDPARKDTAYSYQWYAVGSANNCTASTNLCAVRCVHDAVGK